MTCHSGGTLEIYVEPHLPAPLLWVAGTTPIAGALATLGAAAGWRVTRVRPVRERRGLPGRRARSARRPPSARVDPEASPYVVVATQGQWDEEALAAGAPPRTPSYVGLVASPTRANVVRQWLRDETGLAEERLAALRAPAGIDLGAETAGGDRALDPRRARPGPPRPGRRSSRRPGPATLSGDPRRWSSRRSSPSSTTSSSSIPSAA